MKLTCPNCKREVPCAWRDPLSGNRYRLQPGDEVECGLCRHTWIPKPVLPLTVGSPALPE